MKHVSCYIKGYPRPQFVRSGYRPLNGEWDFAADKTDIGESERWFTSFPAGDKIEVPFAYDTPSGGVADKTKTEVVWYRKSFDFSKEIQGGKGARLNFEGSDYHTKVWVNGLFIGENFGGYHRFGFDITAALKHGAGEIAVKVTDTFDAAQLRGKQKWEDKRFGCWYGETTGIWKTVWAEFLPKSYIKSVKITTDTDDYTARFDYEISSQTLEKNLSLKTVVSFDGVLVGSVAVDITRNTYSHTMHLTGETAPFKVQLWFAHAPNLYDVTYILFENGEEIDRVGSYLGLKKYGTVNDCVTVNDYPVKLMMTLDQGYFEGGVLTPTEEQIVRDVELTKDIGFNGIRKHQKIEDELFYYYCDILGVYVMLEMPSHYEFTDALIEAYTDQMTRIVRQYSSHPCILAYVAFNESWGIQRVFSDRSQQRFTQGIYYLIKSLVGDALVIGNDGWEHTKSDIITLHNYAENGNGLIDAYADMDRALQNKLTKGYPHKFPFADGFCYGGEPVILSEFGGIAFLKDKSGDNWGYGGMVKDEEEFFCRLSGLIKAIYAQPRFAGFCITQTTDVESEINGMLDTDRNFKVDKLRLKNILLNLE